MSHFDFVEYRISGGDRLHNRIHIHNDSYEILQVIDGNGVFLIGETPYPMVPGAVYLTKAVQLHCSHANDNCRYVRSKLAINATYLEKVLETLELSSYLGALFERGTGQYLPLDTATAAMVDERFKRMYDCFHEKTPGASARLTMELIDALLICRSVTANTEPVTEQSSDPLIFRAIKYINLNISSELTVDTIAKEVFVSKYYLCRCFKKYLGISIMKYILNQRLTLAKEQLINSQSKCSDIAMSTGFSSFSYFCRVFKEEEGISPTAYRRLHGKQKGSTVLKGDDI